VYRTERTCIGCRTVGGKHDLVRIVTGPAGILIDYREKLPGRAAYVCPRQSCIRKALSDAALSRAFKKNVSAFDADSFIEQLAGSIKDRIRSLLAIARKAGMMAGGYSAVHDALEKNRVHFLLYAEDLSNGTRDKISGRGGSLPPKETLFTRDEYGQLFNRELIGVVGILDEGFAHAIRHEIVRLKNLLKKDE
jgi:uncharacterized protein